MLFGMYVVPVGHAKKKNSKSTNISYKWKKMDIFVVPAKYGNTFISINGIVCN